MHIDLWTLGLQAINVLVLIWLLSRFLFRPVAAMVVQRRQAAAALLADAEAARARAQAETDSMAKQRAALAADARRLQAEAHQAAEADHAAQLARVQAEIAQARQDGEAALARDRARQQRDLQAGACALAVDIARRLLARIPADAVTRALGQGLTDAIARLPPVERQALVAEADRLRVATAVPLDATGRAEIAASLRAVLDVVPQLDFQVDPTLLGGIALVGPHTLIRNSWQADLERIAAELTTEHADGA